MADTNTPPEENPAPLPQQRRGMRYAIVAQSVGALAHISFRHSIVLLYLLALGVPPARALVYVALPYAASFLSMPVAFWADRLGKKRLGVPGLIGTSTGYGLLALAGALPDAGREPAVLAGIIVFALAQTLCGSSWYALLKPLVPEHMRGRFFGRLRVTWTTVSILFMVVCALVLPKDAPPYVYQWFLAAIAAGQVFKLFFYVRIPEERQAVPEGDGLFKALGFTLRVPRFAPFCAYVFLLMVFTSSAPMLFALLEKDVLSFGDDTVTWLSNLVIGGSVVGFFLGGKAVDRFGAKAVFLLCHFAYAALMALFVFRAVSPVSPVVWAGAINFCFGVIGAASSIAITTETFSLMPRVNESLAGALALGVVMGGNALSNIFAAGVLKVGALRDQWALGGFVLTDCDGILLGYAVMVALLVVTLGQVPSVMGKHTALPGVR